MKFCSRCKQSKSVGEFGPNRHHRDGLQSYCRVCGAESVRRTRLKRGPEQDRQQSRAYWRALRRLVDEHRVEFDRFYAEERAVR